ncbi:MAG: hypothetical protein ICV81_11475, partial [Flavisolibacter sp.]|nr:hypothetical protein [Flavisolibacter sp.]
MKGLSLLWFIFLLYTADALSQKNLPPVFEIDTDTAVYQLEDSFWQMLEDKTGNLTIDQVSTSPISDSFHINTTKQRGINYAIHTFWFRLRLKNNMIREANIVFPNTPQFSDQFDVYIKEDSGWIHETNGFLVPWSKRSGFKMVEAIPVTIPALEEKIIYLRTRINLHYRKPQELQLKAEPTQAFIKEHYVENEAFLFTRIRTAFLFGVLFFCGIMNIFFFSIIRERVYLYYA